MPDVVARRFVQSLISFFVLSLLRVIVAMIQAAV